MMFKYVQTQSPRCNLKIDVNIFVDFLPQHCQLGKGPKVGLLGAENSKS